MPSSNSLLKKLEKDYPGLSFVAGDGFRWSPRDKTVYVGPLTDERALITLLHETAHGLLKHADYARDISLLGLERDAWTLAQRELAPKYGLVIDEETVEDALDSYRDWLDARSKCPDCNQTGLQIGNLEYSCLSCNARWRVNDARQCGLKRYQFSKTK